MIFGNKGAKKIHLWKRNIFQGILLKGKEKVKGYREILSKIHYFNTRADSYSRRIYTVQCAMGGGQILSNEFLVTVSVLK